ncbi:MAG: 2OG-Fe dioxygenase family protein [Cytophagales bacterium]|nr:2OG-Fe dioxygenase family protein [Cytophagales bacterium]
MTTTSEISPKLTTLANLDQQLKTSGYAILNAASVCKWSNCVQDELTPMQASWEAMPVDQYLKDGGRYRRRRHSSFTFENDALTLAPHRAHWQPLTYNALHGGMTRWFEPMPAHILALPAWQKLLTAFAKTANQLNAAFSVGAQYIEAHSFRIEAVEGGLGRPTPEGAHRDGVDLVGVFMVNRHNIKGGETRVFDARSSSGERFTLQEPWSLLLLDDAKVIHETTPIQPLATFGFRDTLVLTCRHGAFLDAQNPSKP